jgi:type I restriction enzyme, S subunit
MTCEWAKVRIGDVAEVYDGLHATPNKTNYGPIFLGINTLENGRLNLSDVEYLSEEDFAKWTRRVTPSANDVVFSYETRIGQAAIVPPGLRCCLGRRMGLVRTNPAKLNPRFFLYQYLSSSYQEFLLSRTIHGSTVDRIPLKDFPDFLLALPPINEQHAIAHILGTLDDKIELNRRMNETLQAIVEAIFKSWLDASDPVCVKAEKLIRDGILEIGDGYRAKNSELGTPGLPFIRAADLNNGLDTEGADCLHQSSVAKAGNKVSRVSDVAFTSKGTIGRFARVGEHTQVFVYSPQVCYWRSLDHDWLHPAILYCWMQTDRFKSQVEAVAGQTDMAPYVSLRDQRQMDIPLFPPSQLAVARMIESLLTRQSFNMTMH